MVLRVAVIAAPQWSEYSRRDRKMIMQVIGKVVDTWDAKKQAPSAATEAAYQEACDRCESLAQYLSTPLAMMRHLRRV